MQNLKKQQISQRSPYQLRRKAVPNIQLPIQSPIASNSSLSTSTSSHSLSTSSCYLAQESPISLSNDSIISKRDPLDIFLTNLKLERYIYKFHEQNLNLDNLVNIYFYKTKELN